MLIYFKLLYYFFSVDAEIGNKSAKCDTANKPQTEKDDHVNESSRKSIFIRKVFLW